jgi:uncharacterized DUF497 family protein
MRVVGLPIRYTRRQMYGIAFEWDTGKDSANQRKHNVGFAEASTVFGDALSVTISEVEVIDEERHVIVGDVRQGESAGGGSYY